MTSIARSIARSLAVLVCTAAPVLSQRQQAAAALPQLSAEAAAALDELSGRFAGETELVQGWFRDRVVLYYNFGAVPRPLSPARVFWPIHGFDARGNPVAMRGQRPIFSTVQGLPGGGYSGLWRLFYVIVADKVQPNELRTIEAVEEIVRRRRGAIRETQLTLNLPIVPRGQRLARDSTQPMAGWYQGREIQFFDFGVVGERPAPMWRFATGVDAEGQPVILEAQNGLLDSLPVEPAYPDLWDIRIVRVDSTYGPNTIKSVAALRASPFRVDSATTVRNLPVVIVDGARVKRAPSPLTEFADLRSPFPPAFTRPQ